LLGILVWYCLAILCQDASTMMADRRDTLDETGANEASIVVSKASSSVLPKMYVLNLDRSPDRWSKMSRQMRHAGLDVERLAAVDGRKLSKEELYKESNLLAMYLQPRGVIGCYLSHKKFWQKVVDEKLDKAIIFEDDVQLVPDFKEKLINNLERFSKEADTNFDVIMLGAIGRVHPEGKDGVGGRFFSIYIGGKRPLKIINDYRYQPRRPAGTHAYMVSYKGAQKLLKLCSKASYHVDLECWRHLDLDLTMFHPMLAYQTFEDTELTDVATDRGKLAEKWTNTALYKKAIDYTRDPNTKQPVSSSSHGSHRH
jgi:glycosyl transferase, family 25